MIPLVKKIVPDRGNHPLFGGFGPQKVTGAPVSWNSDSVMTIALCCPDKFRGSLTAAQAAFAMAEGLREAGVAQAIELPLADGGEGTLDVLLCARGGR